MKSPFEPILNTNYTPSERECLMIKEYLDLPKQELQSLEAQVLQQEAILQKLQQRCDELRNSVDAHQAITSPARRMPDDILREIFLHCLPKDQYASLCPTDSPILLGHICSRWRRLAHTTPRLWSSLHMVTYADYSTVDNVDFDARNAEFTTWVARAGAIPLSISLGSPVPRNHRIFSHNHNMGEMAEWIQRLSYCSTQVDCLNIALTGPGNRVSNVLHKQAVGGKGVFSQVKTLNLRLELTDERNRVASEHQVFIDALEQIGLSRNTRLRELGLYMNCAIHHSSLVRLLPCSQLEVLDLYDYGSEQSMLAITTIPRILHECPNLIVFKVGILKPFLSNDPATASTTTLGRVTLSGLEHATLSFSDFGSLLGVDLMTTCDWPSLKSLHLRNRERRHRPAHILTRIVQKFGNALTSFRMGSRDMTESGFLDLLSALPHLIQLHLEKDVYISDIFGESDSSDNEEVSELHDHPGAFKNAVIAHLTPDQDGLVPHACPQLRYLKWAGNTLFSDECLARFLILRSSSPHSPVSLKQVHINFSRYMQRDVTSECYGVVADGLDLRLVYPDRPTPAPARRTSSSNPKGSLPTHENHLTFGWN